MRQSRGYQMRDRQIGSLELVLDVNRSLHLLVLVSRIGNNGDIEDILRILDGIVNLETGVDVSGQLFGEFRIASRDGESLRLAREQPSGQGDADRDARSPRLPLRSRAGPPSRCR